MFSAVTVIAVVSILAYDGPGSDGEYGLYTYEESDLGDTPYLDDYYEDNYYPAEEYMHEHGYYYHEYDNSYTYSGYYSNEYPDSEYYDYHAYNYVEYESDTGEYPYYQGYINYAPEESEYPDYEPARIHEFSFLDASDYMYLISRLDLYLADELFEMLVALSNINRETLRALDNAYDFAAMLQGVFDDEETAYVLQSLNPQPDNNVQPDGYMSINHYEQRVSTLHQYGAFERMLALDTLIRILDPYDYYEPSGIVAYGGNEIIINPYLRISAPVALRNAIAVASTTVGSFTPISITGNMTLDATQVIVSGGRQVHIQGNVAGPGVGDTTGDAATAGIYNTAFRYIIQNNAQRHFHVTGTNSHLRLQNIVLTSGLAFTNTQHRGGVLVNTGGSLTMQGGSEIRNGRWVNGGGVQVEDHGTFNMTSGLIRQNRAHNAAGTNNSGRGGGVRLIGLNAPRNVVMNMGGGRISHNIASTTGGQNSGWGGGVNVEWYSTLHLYGGVIRNNTASPHTIDGQWPYSSGLGGGVMAAAGTQLNDPARHTFVMWPDNNPIIEHNTARRGGGLAMHHNPAAAVTRTILLGGEIRDNAATEFGGGVYMQSNTILLTHGAGLILRNTAANGGGGMFTSGTVEWTQGTMRENRVTTTTTANNRGGGVFLNAGTFLLGGSAHIGGTAAGHSNRAFRGAGVFVQGGTFTMNGGNIRHNLAVVGNTAGGSPAPTGTGGGVYINGGTFAFGNTTTTKTISNNLAANGGGINRMGGGTFTIGTGTGLININNNEARLGNGGGLRLGGATNLTISNSAVNIFGNSATGTGAAQGRGGGIFKTGAFTLTMSNGTIGGTTDARRNSAARFGGGIDVDQGIFTMSGSTTINGNLASDGGGGVFVQSGDGRTFNMNGGTISGNTATLRGGGVFVAGTASLTSGNIHSNRVNDTVQATSGGGGVYVSGGTVTMSGSAMIGGTTAASANRAFRGAGVFVSSGTFTMNAGSIRHNLAVAGNAAGNPPAPTGNGGGVQVAGGAFTFGNTSTNKTISDNLAANGGGINRVGGALNFGIGTGLININNNEARLGTGGGIRFTGTADVTIGNSAINIFGNSATGTGANQGRGGGIYKTNTFTLTMSNGTIGGTTDARRNSAAQFGGGVYIGQGTFAISGGNIDGNISTGSGGGVSVNSGANFNMSAGTLSGNTATYRGGGIFTSGTVNFTGGNNRENRVLNTAVATSGGGGVYVNAGSFTSSGSATIGGATAANANRAFRGAGVFVYNGTFTMNGGDIRHNLAVAGGAAGSPPAPTGNGGGVYLAGGSFIFGNTATAKHIRNNLAANGGGIYRTSGGVLDVGTGTGLININSNEARLGNGGGLRLGGTANITIGNSVVNISGNIATGTGVAQGSGGGIFKAGPFSLVMSAGSIENNRAVNGGGVSVQGDYTMTFTMTGGTISSNRYDVSGSPITSGGGVHIAGSNATFYMYGGTIGGNAETGEGNLARDGGGVWVGSGASFYMRPPAGGGTVGHISGNEARSNTGSGYTSSGNGGGVWVGGNNTTFTQTGGIIGGPPGSGMGNMANRGGGVSVWIGSNVSFYMGGGIIEGNLASSSGVQLGYNGNGGGVFTRGSTNSFDMSAGTIRHNRANEGGGATISQSSTFTMTGTSRIESNIAEDPTGIRLFEFGTGGGLYISSGSTFDMYNGTIYNNDARIGSVAGPPGNGSGNSGGGGVRVIGGSVFTMHDGLIDNNISLNSLGGGISTADATTRVFIHGGTISNNRARAGGGIRVSGNNRVYMHGGTIRGNIAHYANTARSTAGFGGGVLVQGSDTQFNMYAGTIGGIDIQQNVNAAANQGRYGGGMYIVAGSFNLRGDDEKIITGNRAQNDGGGVWVATAGNMRMQQATPGVTAATDLQITNNTAGGMGGGIFTQDHGDYPDPLVTTPVFPAAGLATHFQNLTLNADTLFQSNTASFIAIPPFNVRTPFFNPLITLPNIGWDTNFLSPPSAPGNQHPLNNFDINFRNEMIDFEFIKTNNVVNPYLGTRLEGAIFQLYWRFNSAEAWVESGPQVISGPDGVVSLTLTAVGQYRLVEVIPPPGFGPTFGYWIIETTTSGGVTTVTAVYNHGGNPWFRQYDYDGDEWWWVGNRPDFMLPLTGGMGVSGFIGVGGLILSAAALMIAVLVLKNKLVIKPVSNK